MMRGEIESDSNHRMVAEEALYRGRGIYQQKREAGRWMACLLRAVVTEWMMKQMALRRKVSTQHTHSQHGMLRLFFLPSSFFHVYERHQTKAVRARA